MRPIKSLSVRCTAAGTTLQGLTATARTAAQDVTRDQETAANLRTQSDAAQEALSHGAQEILAEAARLAQQVEDFGKVLRNLGSRHVDLNGKVGGARTVLEQTEANARRPRLRREDAVARWWSCMDTGLPGLRGIPDPAARHVTAALDPPGQPGRRSRSGTGPTPSIKACFRSACRLGGLP